MVDIKWFQKWQKLLCESVLKRWVTRFITGEGVRVDSSINENFELKWGPVLGTQRRDFDDHPWVKRSHCGDKILTRNAWPYSRGQNSRTGRSVPWRWDGRSIIDLSTPVIGNGRHGFHLEIGILTSIPHSSLWSRRRVDLIPKVWSLHSPYSVSSSEV